MAHVAFLGTGWLGAGMVERMLAGGDTIAVWNRTESKARALEDRGARAAASPEAAVAGAARVHMALTDDAAVDGVVARIATRLEPGATLIDHSTTSPRGARERFERLHAAGVRFIHAPVFMSPQMCREGGGLMLVSALESELAGVRPALERMTGHVWYLGERPDLAACCKLIGNSMLFVLNAGLADVFAMARAMDIEPADALDVFSKFQVGNSIPARGARMVQRDFSVSFELTMARKDLRLILEAAAGQPLAVLPCIADRMDQVIAAGHGNKDLAAIVIPVLEKS